MKKNELLDVLLETNKNNEKPVNSEIIKNILSIIMLNPLEEDRARSQEQIKSIIEKHGEWKNRE